MRKKKKPSRKKTARRKPRRRASRRLKRPRRMTKKSIESAYRGAKRGIIENEWDLYATGRTKKQAQAWRKREMEKARKLKQKRLRALKKSGRKSIRWIANPFGANMSTTQKFIAGLVLGFAGYVLYKKYKGTAPQQISANTDVSQIAGWMH